MATAKKVVDINEVTEEVTKAVEANDEESTVKKDGIIKRSGAFIKKNWKVVTAVTLGVGSGLVVGAKVGKNSALKKLNIIDVAGDAIDVVTDVAEDVVENID